MYCAKKIVCLSICNKIWPQLEWAEIFGNPVDYTYNKRFASLAAKAIFVSTFSPFLTKKVIFD